MRRRTFCTGSTLGLIASVAGASPLLAGTLVKSKQREYDTAIIGAGLFGSAAARHLSKMSSDVILIGPAEPDIQQQEAGVAASFASYYSESRATRIFDTDLAWGVLAKRSLARLREIERQSGISFYDENGYMMVSPPGFGTNWVDFDKLHAVANDLSVAVEDLNHKALLHRFPFLQFTPDSTAMIQTIDAGYLNPRRLVEAQQKLAIQQGVQLVRDEAVQLDAMDSHVKVSLLSGDTITAKRVLLATGAATNNIKLLPLQLDAKLEMQTYALAEVASDTVLDFPATLYAKTDGENPFAGMLMPPIVYPDGRSYIKVEGQSLRPDVSNDMQQVVKDVLPNVETRSTKLNACPVFNTTTHYPYIDMVDDRIGIVVGGNGKGAKASDEIGRLAAEMINTGAWSDTMPQSLFAMQVASSS